MEIRCDWCGKEFWVYPSWANRRFCSKGCFDEWQRGKPNLKNSKPKIKKKCLFCGKIFKVCPSKVNRKFCSLVCRNRDYSKRTGFWLGKHRSEGTRRKTSTKLKGRFVGPNNHNWFEKERKICPICGKGFYVRKYGPKKFCSLPCYWKWLSQNPTELIKRKISTKLPPRKCLVCHGVFQPHDSKQIYCSRWCYHKDERIRKIRSETHRGRRNSLETREKIRSARLKQIFPPRDTLPEKLFEKVLIENWIVGWKKHVPVGKICQPDFVFPKQKIAVFIDGDYWHANPRFYHRLNETQEFNAGRDTKANDFLRKEGWKVLRFWEFDINNNINNVMGALEEVIGSVDANP